MRGSVPMINRYHHRLIEPRIWVMPYARAEGKHFATGDVPSKIDTKEPSSHR